MGRFLLIIVYWMRIYESRVRGESLHDCQDQSNKEKYGEFESRVGKRNIWKELPFDAWNEATNDFFFTIHSSRKRRQNIEIFANYDRLICGRILLWQNTSTLNEDLSLAEAAHFIFFPHACVEDRKKNLTIFSGDFLRQILLVAFLDSRRTFTLLL